MRLAFIAGCTILAGLLLAPRIAVARVSISGPSGAGASAANISLQINNNAITAEVADTEPLRTKGLMHRKTLAHDHGMLFVFADDQPRCFWMKNTLIPLSIAFLDRHGTIVALDEMQPHSEVPHCSGADARYALEMNHDWFRSHHIQVDDNIKAVIPDTLPAAKDGVPATLQ
ncbi:MAG: DUF192 domain-containing protein [Advenella sp.]|uniref:DUF192 domain-containing protein n=1 Tax=Advenella sp. TaxID=1872388 RepID=UPI003F97D987